MRRRLTVPVLLAAGLFAALAVAAFSAGGVSFRSARVEGERVAEVLVGDQVVMELRASGGGYSPLERAEIVAGRLRAAMAKDFNAEGVQVRSVLSGHGLYIDNGLIVTVDKKEGDAHGKSTEALATEWRANLLEAMGMETAEEESSAGGPAAAPESAPGEAPGGAEASPGSDQPSATATAASETAAPTEPPLDWTGTAQKWVPIFSLETEGAYIGAAQIAGPKSQVDKVKGVAELRLNFRNLGRIYAYIPVSTISVSKLNRVQGVSVWATGDLELVNF
jgi:cobalamin biosynthesis Mg chelatase CobN